MILPSSLVLFFSMEVVGPQATCEGCMAWPCGRHSHPPSPGRVFFTRPSTDCHAIVYPGHASCPGRWRALSEVPFGRSPGRNKLRSQAAGLAMRFYASLERRQPPPPCPLLVCALGEHRRPTALKPLLLRSQATTGSCGHPPPEQQATLNLCASLKLLLRLA